jgi:hypothetical protein
VQEAKKITTWGYAQSWLKFDRDPICWKFSVSPISCNPCWTFLLHGNVVLLKVRLGSNMSKF